MASPPSNFDTATQFLLSPPRLLHSPHPLLQNCDSPNSAANNGCGLYNSGDPLPDSIYCHIDSSQEKDMQVLNVEETHGKSNNSTDTNAKMKYDGVEPFKGMAFESLEEVHHFYYSYARVHGFSVRIRQSSYFPRSTEIRYRRFVCSCEGNCSEKKLVAAEKKEKNTLTGRKGCPVNFTVSRKLCRDQWVAITVENVHNHVLPSPRSAKNLRNQKVMPLLAKNLVEKFSEVGLPTGKVLEILSDEPEVNISSRDCRNHMRNLRTMNLDVGDAKSVFQYCKMKQVQDPNFYYSILLDNESRMVNFFWVDSRARLYYERFGDVVVFDTTYKTNKYGTNHHFQWLFETWLDAMHGKAPISIITDQDKAIANAIKKVFPNTTHRLCLWHIMKKFPEKYGNFYKNKSPFSKDIKKCLHQSITIDEFEEEWKEIMKRYNLEGEAWLQQIFTIRKHWVPVYNQTIFFAGMNTTQRCESMHAFFDSFVHSGTTLREFVAKYEQALMRRYQDENREHYASKHMQPVPKIRPPISEHAAMVYTRAIFNMFEDEVLESLRVIKKKLEKNASSCTYLVSSNQNSNQKFIVLVDTSSWDASCECHLFEFKGILCWHILAIFQKKDVQKIPTKYILPRWTKEAADDIPIPLTREADKSSIIRTLHFHRKTNLLLPYLHDSDEAFQVIMDAMDRAYDEVLK